MSDWPFPDPPTCTAITLRQIVHEGEGIHCVTHDAEDGCWQFLGIHYPHEKDAVMVSLEEMTILDSSVSTLADLPFGWFAWRDKPADPWQRADNRPWHFKKILAGGPELEKAKGEEALWTAPQFGLLALLGIAMVLTVLFSLFAILRIDCSKGLFGALILALIARIVVDVRRMVKRSAQKPLNQDEPREKTDCHETDGRHA
jgi:hypothetical protein